MGRAVTAHASSSVDLPLPSRAALACPGNSAIADPRSSFDARSSQHFRPPAMLLRAPCTRITASSMCIRPAVHPCRGQTPARREHRTGGSAPRLPDSSAEDGVALLEARHRRGLRQFVAGRGLGGLQLCSHRQASLFHFIPQHQLRRSPSNFRSPPPVRATPRRPSRHRDASTAPTPLLDRSASASSISTGARFTLSERNDKIKFSLSPPLLPAGGPS